MRENGQWFCILGCVLERERMMQTPQFFFLDLRFSHPWPLRKRSTVKLAGLLNEEKTQK